MIPVHIAQPLNADKTWSQEAKDEVLEYTVVAVRQKLPVDTWCLVDVAGSHFVGRTAQVRDRGHEPAWIPSQADLDAFTTRK
jgi:hypothetical protein